MSSPHIVREEEEEHGEGDVWGAIALILLLAGVYVALSLEHASRV